MTVGNLRCRFWPSFLVRGAAGLALLLAGSASARAEDYTGLAVFALLMIALAVIVGLVVLALVVVLAGVTTWCLVRRCKRKRLWLLFPVFAVLYAIPPVLAVCYWDELSAAKVQVQAHWGDPAAVDQDGETRLHLAAYRLNTAALRTLVARGAPVNARNRAGRTPLHCLFAGSAGPATADTLEVLLAAHADVTLADQSGATALHLAARRSDAPALVTLLKAGATVDAEDHDGTTPLACAVQGYYLVAQTIPVLLAAGAQPNHADHDGDTPLHLAARAYQAAAITLLLAHGADPNRVNAAGHRPLDLVPRGDTTVAPLLVAAGAIRTPPAVAVPTTAK